MQLSKQEYLYGAYKKWPGDWEGDFDYVDGMLVRHDWGDYPHSTMQAHLMGWLGKFMSDWQIYVRPSLTLQITTARFRVPDFAIFDHKPAAEGSATTTVPLVVIEVLSPEDTMMHVAALVADYQSMGIANIWIVDPKQTGWDCRAGNWFQSDKFAVAGTPITVDLSNFGPD
ncbi:MAG: Uma2 family endonuclease [Acidobacteriaceae bacterium]|jgi:Uma2 family endonuclease